MHCVNSMTLLLYAYSRILSGYGEVRLSGGSSNNSGTLEVSVTEASWTTVCLDGFDGVAATVVCRQLGYDHGSYYPTYVFCVCMCMYIYIYILVL